MILQWCPRCQAHRETLDHNYHYAHESVVEVVCHACGATLAVHHYPKPVGEAWSRGVRSCF